MSARPRRAVGATRLLAAAVLYLGLAGVAHACGADRIAATWIDGSGNRWTFRQGAPGAGNFVDIDGAAETAFARAFGEPLLWRALDSDHIRVLTIPPGDYTVVGVPEAIYRCRIVNGEMRWTNGNGPPVTFRAAP